MYKICSIKTTVCSKKISYLIIKAVIETNKKREYSRYYRCRCRASDT